MQSPMHDRAEIITSRGVNLQIICKAGHPFLVNTTAKVCIATISRIMVEIQPTQSCLTTRPHGKISPPPICQVGKIPPGPGQLERIFGHHMTSFIDVINDGVKNSIHKSIFLNEALTIALKYESFKK